MAATRKSVAAIATRLPGVVPARSPARLSCQRMPCAAAFSMDRVRGFENASGSAANLASALTGTWLGFGGMIDRTASGDRRVAASVAIFSMTGMFRVRTWAPDDAWRGRPVEVPDRQMPEPQPGDEGYMLVTNDRVDFTPLMERELGVIGPAHRDWGRSSISGSRCIGCTGRLGSFQTVDAAYRCNASHRSNTCGQSL